MSEFLHFKSPSAVRQEFVFQVGKTRITTQENKTIYFPSIVLYHRESGIPVGYPGYERWLYEMHRVEEQKTETLRKKAHVLCSFLNFLLWKTTCDRLQEISLKELRDFFLYYKETAAGKPRDPQEWSRGVTDVVRFMHAYIMSNKDKMTFKMVPEDLISPYRITRKDGKSTLVIDKANRLYVKPPIKEKKKYRFLLHGYLELLIFEAKKFDPMILPAIMLQAYAGLREGEVVNVSVTSISRIYSGFGRIGKIVIDLKRNAGFAERYEGKTGFGAIKVFRPQEVYTDFLEKVLDCLDEHEMRLRSSGYLLDEGSPLFYTQSGKPMSVSTYTSRLKRLFYKHFLPDLKKVCEAQGIWAQHAPYIEAYEREYPGAHMLRHWFTMCLLEYKSMKPELVSHWRGDGDPTALEDYIHVNSDFISVYCDSVFSVQGALMEGIL